MEGSVGRHYTGAQPASDGGMTTPNTAAGLEKKRQYWKSWVVLSIKIPPKMYRGSLIMIIGVLTFRFFNIP